MRSGAISQDLALQRHMLLRCCNFNPAEIWVACAVLVAGLLGLVVSGPVRVSAAIIQRHGGQLTLRLLLSSLSDSTGLGHLAPPGCVQPPQLSGNGG